MKKLLVLIGLAGLAIAAYTLLARFRGGEESAAPESIAA